MSTLSLRLVLCLLATAGASAADPGLQVFGQTPSPVLRWAQAVGEVDADSDEIDGVALDPEGNTVISGVFRTDIKLGDTLFHGRGAGDIFLASIAPDGRYRWARQFGSVGDDNTFDLQTDGAGNIIASGWFSDAIDFDGITLTSQGETDMFIAKFSPDGKTLWAKSFGGPAGDGGNEVSVLPDGEIAVSAITAGAISFDGRAYAYGGPGHGGGRDAYVVRLGSDGTVKWVHPFNGPGTERIRAMSMDAAGNVQVGFQFRVSVTSGTQTLRSHGDWDGALARLTPDGALAWLLPVGGPGTDLVRGAGVDADGNIYASGVCEADALLFDRQLPASRGGKGTDFIAKLSPSGQRLWLLTLGGDGRHLGGEIRMNEHGVLISAFAEGSMTVHLDDRLVAQVEQPAFSQTSYLASFAPDGSPRFLYVPPSDGKGGGALGDVLATTPDGRRLVQVLRFRKRFPIGGSVLLTLSLKDSAMLMFTCDKP